jgi:hypothetical protein
VVGDHDAQDGVAQELQSFVRGPAGVLGAPGAVDEGGTEQRGVVDRAVEPLVELCEARRDVQELTYSFATT